MSRSRRHVLVVLLAVAVVAVLAYRSRGAIGLEGFSWSRLAEDLTQTQPLPLVASLLAIFIAYGVRTLRWVRFSRYLGDLRHGSVFSSTLIGFTAIFLLGRVGEPVRPLLIARKDRVPVSSSFGIYALERVFDIAATVVIAGLGLLIFTPPSLGEQSRALLVTARTAGLVLLIGLLAMIGSLIYFRVHGASRLEKRLAEWDHRPGWHARAAGMFRGFADGLHAIRTPTDLFLAIGYTSAHWFIVLLIYLWVPHSFPGRLGELGMAAMLLVLAFTMVGSTIQLPAVGGGAQAASFLALTLIFGVEKEPAAAASVLLWLITFAGCSLAGVPLLIREGWSMGELRRLARAEDAAEEMGTHVSLNNAHTSVRDAKP